MKYFFTKYTAFFMNSNIMRMVHAVNDGSLYCLFPKQDGFGYYRALNNLRFRKACFLFLLSNLASFPILCNKNIDMGTRFFCFPIHFTEFVFMNNYISEEDMRLARNVQYIKLFIHSPSLHFSIPFFSFSIFNRQRPKLFGR